MSINLTDEIEVKTKKGKLGAAKQIFLEGDTQTVENEIQDINSRHNDLNSKHELLSSTVSEHTNQIESNQNQITANKSIQDAKNASLDANMAKLNTRDDQITELVRGITATGGASVATTVTYDNTSSHLASATVQGAIDELQGSKIDKTSILQELGNAEDKVMSQKAVSDELSKVDGKVDELEPEVIYDVTANNNGVTFGSLSALLSDENLSTLIPSTVRCGGMSIRFLNSSDNKYVQYMLLTTTFSTIESDWQEVNIVYINNILSRAFNEKLNYYNRAAGSLRHSDKTIDTYVGYINYYNVSSFSKILLRCKTGIVVENNWDILWVCDSSNNILYQLLITQKNQEFYSFITLDANADHVIVSDYGNSYLELYSVSKEGEIINVNNLNETVENLSDVVDKHDTILNRTGKIELTKIEDINPGVLNTSGDLMTNYSGYKVSVYDVSSLNEVIASAHIKLNTTAQWAAWQLRDINRNYIPGTAQSINPLGGKYENKTIDVSNAYYLYIQSDLSAKVEKFIGVQALINELQTDIQNNTDSINLLDDRVSKLEGSKKSIICWGDSLTNGAGITPYTVYLQQLLPNSYTVYNGGVEGDSTSGIINRQGGNSPKVLEDFTLPATTEEVNAPISISSLIYTGSGTNSKSLVNPCTIKGIECTVYKKTMDGEYTIRRAVAADNSENIKAGTQIITYGAKYMRDCDIAIFYCGQNDGVSNYKNTIHLINKGINFLQKKNYIVISTAISRSADYENSFYDAYGVNYINLFHMMSNYGIETGIKLGLINEGTPATSWNTIDATGSNKNGLLKDSIHWNVNGLKVLANFVYNRLVEIGYVKLE